MDCSAAEVGRYAWIIHTAVFLEVSKDLGKSLSSYGAFIGVSLGDAYNARWIPAQVIGWCHRVQAAVNRRLWDAREDVIYKPGEKDVLINTGMIIGCSLKAIIPCPRTLCKTASQLKN